MTAETIEHSGTRELTTPDNRQLTTTPKRDEQSFAKANEAIAIRPKRGRLTLLSLRIYNTLLHHAQRQGVDQPIYSISLTTLIKGAFFNSNNTEILKSHLRDMQATTIEWSTSGAGQRRWVSTQLIGTVTIDEPGRGRPCTISWRFPEEIQERLLKPIQYTNLLLETGGHMRTYTAARLHEMGSRYLSSPSRLTARDDILWWAAVLTGRSDITEVDYRFFKRDVILKGLSELDVICNEFSMELIEHKRGRKVEELQFRVVPKYQPPLNSIHGTKDNAMDLELVDRLVKIGLKYQDAQDLYAVTEEGALRANIEHTELRMRSASLPELKSPVAYFRDALRKGYAKDTAKVDEGAKPRPREVRDFSHEKSLQRVRDAWHSDRMAQARSLFAEFSAQDQATLRARFDTEQVEHLAPMIARAWARDGISSRLAAGTFFRWFADITWPEEPTEKTLLEFALAKGVVKFD